MMDPEAINSPEIANSFENNGTVLDNPNPEVTPLNIESESNESVSQTDIVDMSRGPIQHITDHYFMPKSFESKGLYESLGVRTFKKYVPTGDKAVKHFWSKVGFKSFMLNENYNNRQDMLKAYERNTRIWETTHLGLMGAITANEVADDGYSSIRSVVGSIAVQVVVNVYPIMVQRYNRIRILPLIDSSGESVNPVE